jgi:polysaccharide biosynthesis protein PslH
MRILQLANKIPYPPKDGGAIATLNLSLSLAKQGHDVTILGMNTSKHYIDLADIPEDISKLVKIEDVKIDTSLDFRAAVKNLLFSKLPYNAERFFNIRYTERLIDMLKENQYDIIQLEGLYMCFYIKTIREHSNALITLRSHNIEHEIWSRTARQEKSLFKKIYFRILSKRIRQFKLHVINTYDLLVPITRRDAEKFSELGNLKPSCVIPAGYDGSKLVPDNQKVNFPGIFYIGTLDWFPNQEGITWFVKKVWNMLYNKYPDLKLFIAGRNAPEWLKKSFHKPNIEFLGEIEDAYSFMNQNAIMIVPLFSGSGMRVKIVEGMAMGKAIITTSLGAEGIDVTHGKDIFIEDTAKGFVERIKELIGDRQLYDQMGHNARLFVEEHYDNDKIASSLIEFYKKFAKI